ncbi:helix-turn-helix domain-containing protein [Paenibacillus sp. LMG 31461]|uniref:Helix-turn-helix domain-containing protein n=1 Tax=Paenibacillus plantarum TaxID=2654975 RepID=A0ABX1XC21_9BACL|nr:AraC family transcriptional regulator [Paenibacillus plantarum]NOU65513.1 helix-turn-helix domain-containing protein [Paenibacillus plantarum]
MQTTYVPRKRYSTSLFYRLLISFIIIILLLVSFNVASFTFFRSSIREEIIKNSSLNLETTVASYEKNISLIKSLLVSSYFNTHTEALKNNPQKLDFYISSQVQRELQNVLANNQLSLYNIIYYFPNRDFVIDKDGSRDAQMMFSKFYTSPTYPEQFWSTETGKSSLSFRVYPSAEFQESTSFSTRSFGKFNPVLFKSAATDGFAIIALLDSDQMFEAYSHFQADSNFYILDDAGGETYAVTSRQIPLQLKPHTDSSGYYLEGTNYYFYKQGAVTGNTYVLIVPFATISEQFFKLNVFMIGLIFLSVIIGVGISILFAKRFNNPLNTIISSIQQMDRPQSVPFVSPIREFNVISQKLHDLFLTNETINRDLLSKNSLLKHYAYLNKVKMIHTDIEDAKISIDSDKPYVIVLYQLMYIDNQLAAMDMDPNRASYYIKEFVQSQFIQAYKDALTFQIEKDQILTIIFTNDSELSVLDSLLLDIKKIFELDASYCSVTIAVSPVHDNAFIFNEAFENTLLLAKQRKLGEGVQIIREKEILPPDLWLTPANMKEFTANLTSGNPTITIPIVSKTLELAVKRGASYAQIHDLAKEIVNLIIKTLYSSHNPISLLDDKRSPADILKNCRTLEQFQQFFKEILTQSASDIRQKKEATDHITSFVTNYVNEHFGSDLSLDLLADKLNITGAYLSTYFKEKTEINFSDYVNTVRMNKAMELLEKTDLKIQDVSTLVGYYTIASFNRMFKKHTGITPSEFRRARMN